MCIVDLSMMHGIQLFRQHELEMLLSMIHEAACCVVDDGKSELGFAI